MARRNQGKVDQRGHPRRLRAAINKEETMKDFKVGDVVQLKSGGPKMTLFKAANTDGTNVVCVFILSGQVVEYTFKSECLKHYRPFWKRFWR